MAHRTPIKGPHARTFRTFSRMDFALTRTTTHRTCAGAHAPSQLIPWELCLILNISFGYHISEFWNSAKFKYLLRFFVIAQNCGNKFLIRQRIFWDKKEKRLNFEQLEKNLNKLLAIRITLILDIQTSSYFKLTDDVEDIE